MSNEQRIKLAEAMGWVRDENWDAWILQVSEKHREIRRDPELLPDPFTDANDDYAVLEWMRKHERWLFMKMYINEGFREVSDYQIGDYARACLKVINEQ